MPREKAGSGWIHDNGLSIALLSLFALSVIGHFFAGWGAENQERLQHGEAALGGVQFLTGGQFLSTLFENWESEFLQMWAYVMLTAYLFQRGSPESKDPEGGNPQDRDPKLDEGKPDAPWPVRAGGPLRVLYAHSLGLAMLILFMASFVLHLINSVRHQNEDARAHGQPIETLWSHLTGHEFWFESFQNWQSEFLSTGLLVILAIHLREKGSPESKPVSHPHSETGV
ncbi:DUF6766 family protein [Brevundimonas sp.]|uniref:DUF6766 family protein n=1 Tax=Brevundimonas sp. TaxID=1871086 RepID=UPI0025F1D134|nr:DUF6766 family protein [Brevundimonas sp.]